MATELSEERGLRALPYLVRAAKEHRTVTYGELAEHVGCHPHRVELPIGLCPGRHLHGSGVSDAVRHRRALVRGPAGQ